ncbi:hypothetical protein DAPPUDRAFT_257576 [Daphnia pulex]|uniref:Uncharacterized protein n=1 Tax=Daphnia pulex TaxID=6669 RepID=E9HDU6_DAPPU|nr:hypothetical protein DAPPUDRAFT_257576 [Daphnia pulex]|eukprot:EFX70087.1 hypothetical protein DAPPUDRAFT_257576 [Daphnia pulex]
MRDASTTEFRGMEYLSKAYPCRSADQVENPPLLGACWEQHSQLKRGGWNGGRDEGSGESEEGEAGHIGFALSATLQTLMAASSVFCKTIRRLNRKEKKIFKAVKKTKIQTKILADAAVASASAAAASASATAASAPAAAASAASSNLSDEEDCEPNYTSQDTQRITENGDRNAKRCDRCSRDLICGWFHGHGSN